MQIKAHDAKGFGRLMKAMTEDESPNWLGLRTSQAIDMIRAELVVLEQQTEAIKPDDDMILESLVRIASLARCHAADNDLAYAKEIPA